MAEGRLEVFYHTLLDRSFFAHDDRKRSRPGVASIIYVGKFGLNWRPLEGGVRRQLFCTSLYIYKIDLQRMPLLTWWVMGVWQGHTSLSVAGVYFFQMFMFQLVHLIPYHHHLTYYSGML